MRKKDARRGTQERRAIADSISREVFVMRGNSLMRAVLFVLVGAVIVMAAGCGSGGGLASDAAGRSGSVEGDTGVDGTSRSALDAGMTSGGTVQVQGTQLTSPVDTNGHFRIDGVPEGEQVVSLISPDGMSAAHMAVKVRPGQATHIGTVRPHRAGIIYGQVMGRKDGEIAQPLGAAKIWVFPYQNDVEAISEIPNDRPLFRAETKRNGSYLVRGVPSGKYVVIAAKQGWQKGVKKVRVNSRERVVANFKLHAIEGDTATVYGRVITEEDGVRVGLPRALVMLAPQLRPNPDNSKAAAGTDTLSTMTLTIQELETKFPAERPKPLPSGPGNVDSKNDIIMAWTGPRGEYIVPNVPLGLYTAMAFKKGYSREVKTLPIRKNGRHELHFYLKPIRPPLGLVHGKAIDARTGRPIARVRITAYPIRDAAGLSSTNATEAIGGYVVDDQIVGHLPGQNDNYTRPIRPVHSSYTNEHGEYKIRLRPGNYALAAMHRHYHAQREEAQVNAGSTSTVNFKLKPRVIEQSDSDNAISAATGKPR